MRETPSELYTEQWFRRRTPYRGTYRVFAETTEELWAPESVLELGCGAGYFLAHFAGRVPTLGVEAADGAFAVMPPDVRKRVVRRDLRTEPAEVALALEFAVCLEVLEHIEENDLPAVMEWFGGCQRALVSAAPPGQGGLHHVNEQPPAYWRERFRERRLIYRAGETERWRRRARQRTHGCPWVMRNAMFFARRDGGGQAVRRTADTSTGVTV